MHPPLHILALRVQLGCQQVRELRSRRAEERPRTLPQVVKEDPLRSSCRVDAAPLRFDQTLI